jgi:hypothetical protein
MPCVLYATPRNVHIKMKLFRTRTEAEDGVDLRDMSGQRVPPLVQNVVINCDGYSLLTSFKVGSNRQGIPRVKKGHVSRTWFDVSTTSTTRP